MVVGQLVREDCSDESKAPLGTIVKVTELILHRDSQWKVEVERWKSYNTKCDQTMCSVIRPGKVASVRWQNDPKKLTVHIFYDDCGGRSSINLSTNSVSLVQ